MTRAQSATTIVGPLDMKGLPGAATVLAALTHGVAFLKSTAKDFDSAWGEVRGLPLTPEEWRMRLGGAQIGKEGLDRIPLALAISTHVVCKQRKRQATDRYHLILALHRNIAPLPHGLQWPKESKWGGQSPLVWAYTRDHSRSPEWIAIPTHDTWILWHQYYDLQITSCNDNPHAERRRLHFMYFYDAWRKQPQLDKHDDLRRPNQRVLTPRTPQWYATQTAKASERISAKRKTEQEGTAASSSTEPAKAARPKAAREPREPASRKWVVREAKPDSTRTETEARKRLMHQAALSTAKQARRKIYQGSTTSHRLSAHTA